MSKLMGVLKRFGPGRVLVSLVFAVGLLAMTVVAVWAFPPNPQYLYGTAKTTTGSSLPQGKVVEARVLTAGGWTGRPSATVDSNGNYGYSPVLQVVGNEAGSPPYNGARPGDQLGLFVDGIQAELYNPDTDQTSMSFTWTSGATTPLNLSVNLVYTITATAGAGGTITPSGLITVPFGASQAFTITANSGSTIADVGVDGGSVGAVAHYTFSNVQASHTISATFTRLSYTIAASAGANGTINPSGNVAVQCGADQAFAIAPSNGYNIVAVVVDGLSQGAVTSYSFTNVQANHTISATFATQTFVITPTAGTGGSISPATPQNVPIGGSAAFSITASACYTIAAVVVDGVPVGAVSSYTFTNVQTPHTIHATFAYSGVSYTISASAGANGTITPSGNVAVQCGADQAFAIAPSSGYSIAGVVVDSIAQGPVASYTFTDVHAAHTISATFAVQTFVITPTVGTGGSISPATPQTVPFGGSAGFTITASACYTIADVLVDGASVGAVASHTFTDVQANHTISATFTRLSYTIAASATANGTITPSGNVAVQCGADQTFGIAPSSGFIIKDVLVDGVSVGAPASYTFTNVQANRTIAAQFAVPLCNVQQFTAPLGTGWNLFSTPVRLATGSDTVGAIFSPAEQLKLDIVYRWDAATGLWVLVQGSNQLVPLDALYVKVKTGNTATALLVPSTSPTGLPSRSLSAGMNLIGPAPAFNSATCSFPAMPVNQALTTVLWASGGLQGYSTAVSPGLNQTGWSYFRDGGAGPNMDPYKGYWVTMYNAATLFGSSTTPLAP